MTVGDVIGFIAINAVLIAALQWLTAMWLRARLEASIRHEYDVALAKLKNEYDQQLEVFRFEQRRRERAAMIAELFAGGSQDRPTMSKGSIASHSKRVSGYRTTSL
jgi:hypothetical protein